jgi:hypothetical protein
MTDARPTIPDLELDLFTTTVDVAVSRANRGDVAGGHDELLYGLHRAEAARDDGEAWGPEPKNIEGERHSARIPYEESCARLLTIPVEPNLQVWRITRWN